MGHGIGMPRGMPRTKRTAKPARHTYDLLSWAKQGVIPKENITLTESSATITHNNMTCMISRERYDRFMDDNKSVGTLIKIAPSWIDIHREQLP